NELESEGAALRERFLRSALAARAPGAPEDASPDASADGGAAAAADDFDALFLDHRARQRRLRKAAALAPPSPSLEELRALAARTATALARPFGVGTVADARAFLDADVALEQDVDAALAIEAGGADAWRLAHENEVVALLADQVSDAARAQAYGFSRELVDDVRSEVAIAVDRARAGLERLRTDIPDTASLVATERGEGVLARLAGLLAVAGGALVARRRAPHVSVALVKALARVPELRAHVGLLVRIAGLVQQVLPVAIAIAALAAAIAILGSDLWLARLLGAVGWPVLVYVLGRQVLLGLTQRVTRGRPALVELRAADRERLVRTYASLGLFVAGALLLDRMVRMLVGGGRLVGLVDGAVLAWVAAWAVFEMFRWRAPLAERWGALAAGTTFELRVAESMAGSPLGAVLSPVALVRVVATPAWRALAAFATETDLAQALRARLLRRRSRHAQAEAGETKPAAIPDEYLAAFPLHPILGEEEQVLVPREELVREVLDQIARWRETQVDGSLAIVGEKGLGKTTLAAMIARRANGVEVVAHTLRGKPTTERDLLRELAPAFEGAHAPESVAKLAEALCAGPERIVLLDEAHNVFLRMVDGYEAYDALVELVNSTSERVFWVPVFNSFTWRFLNESRGRVHYFRRILDLPRWTADEIQELVRLRNEKAGFALEFDEVLLSEEDAVRERALAHGARDGFELVESADGYFRLLWESSGGNPRIATQLWLASLSPVAERRLRVGLFREPESKAFEALNDELWFALAAVCQHENLSADELARAINATPGFARFAVQFLAEAGFVTAKDERWERVTLSAAYYRQVLRGLRSKHLLYD
ncbi:MAG: ATP-binding protein, partial [Myxococcales bacterium]|nr:ATP-binding protein [Myxococcales bacterium]